MNHSVVFYQGLEIKEQRYRPPALCRLLQIIAVGVDIARVQYRLPLPTRGCDGQMKLAFMAQK